MLDLLRNAGPSGYLILFLGALGAVLAVVTLGLFVSRQTLRASVVLAGVLAGLGAATLLLGATGRIAGRMATFRAVAHMDPDQRDALIEQGFEEASANTTLGGLSGGPMLLLGVAVIGGAFARTGGRS